MAGEVRILLIPISEITVNPGRREAAPGDVKELADSILEVGLINPNHQLYTVQTTASQPLEEADPTGLVLFHTLSGAKNFTVSVLIYRNRHQNSCILILSAPVPPQIDPVHIYYFRTERSEVICAMFCGCRCLQR